MHYEYLLRAWMCLHVSHFLFVNTENIPLTDGECCRQCKLPWWLHHWDSSCVRAECVTRLKHVSHNWSILFICNILSCWYKVVIYILNYAQAIPSNYVYFSIKQIRCAMPLSQMINAWSLIPWGQRKMAAILPIFSNALSECKSSYFDSNLSLNHHWFV